MSSTQPLGVLVTRFMESVGRFNNTRLDLDSSGIEHSGDLLSDFERNWPVAAPRLAKAMQESLSSMDMERAEMLRAATEISRATNDSRVTQPVADLIRMTDEIADDLKKVHSLTENATTKAQGFAVISELFAVAARRDGYGQEVAKRSLSLLFGLAVVSLTRQPA